MLKSYTMVASGAPGIQQPSQSASISDMLVLNIKAASAFMCRLQSFPCELVLVWVSTYTCVAMTSQEPVRL